MRNMRARLYACLASDALLGVNHPDIPVLGADMGGACRAISHAKRIRALATHVLLNVERIFGENGPMHLNPGKR
jgi:hypothetical protein